MSPGSDSTSERVSTVTNVASVYSTMRVTVSETVIWSRYLVSAVAAKLASRSV